MSERPARRWRDRPWFWPALGVLPAAAIVLGVIATSGRPGYVDGLAHLDHDPTCDEDASCEPAVLVDGAPWRTVCRTVDDARVSDEKVAQGPGGVGYRIRDVDPAVAMAVRDPSVCTWERDAILVGRCLAVAGGVLDAAC
ncbi:MAG: hypothetical protein QNJ12_18075 [Ilumatobacter sp.]|uniref:hypothetical protein n=1 Tax=Ilumatobacter sp. TaxID=1967498 RepID=UPI002626547B|nr:hypothetical protein [Ilumatobacter sp.]MDJ0770707.1 hypothetical protein [Ilumatobacter sp.]